MAHPLDRPVWNALAGRQRPLAQGDARARRFPAEYGPFGALADGSPEGWAALIALNPAEGGLALVEAEPELAPADVAFVQQSEIMQMTMAALRPGPVADFEVLTLGDADAPEMRALAELTRPGPFSTQTHRLGRFVGVRQAGKLIAMAGERMKPDGFTEVSGVCTHPDWRGRGYAAALIRIVAGAILERGETPFLHSFAANTHAIALYEVLGFRRRRAMVMRVLGPRS